MAGERGPSKRAAEKIIRLASAPTDVASLWRETTEVLVEAVPHFWAPCFFTLDPASLLITSHFHDGMPEFPANMLADEYYTEDVNQLAAVATSAMGMSTLHEATSGHPEQSRRWHNNMAFGGDQELVTRLRTRSGEVWGMLSLYREPDSPLFDQSEKDFLRTISPYLADAARRALLIGEASDPEYPDSPGLVILTEQWEVASTTPGIERWLADLPDGDWAARKLPAAVLAVAGRALRAAANPLQGGPIAVARVRSQSGTWLMLHGSCLHEQSERRIAVIIEVAHPARIYPLLMAAYKLSDREREVTNLVLRGASTDQIAAELNVAAQTVQQHLKNIFEKTGVRSRRDLMGKIFFAHYEPRLRDNEQRVTVRKAIRGGPANAR